MFLIPKDPDHNVVAMAYEQYPADDYNEVWRRLKPVHGAHEYYGTIYRTLSQSCLHCFDPWKDHVGLKCVFGPTEYESLDLPRIEYLIKVYEAYRGIILPKPRR